MNTIATLYPLVIIVIGLLVLTTNVFVEVIKKVVPNSKFPTNIVAVIVALALTLIVFFAWANLKGITVLWYYVAAAVVIGVFVAFGAMFGFDKLKEVLKQFQNAASGQPPDMKTITGFGNKE